MSEPVSKQRPTVDLDDFERQMRPAQHYDDPLAELARLVGEQPDPYGDVFAREAAAPAHAAPEPYEAQFRENGRREPGFASAQSVSPRFSGDFAAIEAGLRGSIPAHDAYASHHAEPSFESRHDRAPAYDPAQDYEHANAEPTAYGAPWQEPGRAAPSRSRRPAYLLAATIAVGVIGIGTAFALKGHIATSPREVKTILADESPTKVQPPAETAADTQANQDAAVLGKGQPAPTALANHEEQPVDLLQAARENAAAEAARTNADSVPVPPSPGQIQTALADPASAGTQTFPGTDIAPKRVRVVSVRPDGTILPSDNAAPTATPAPRAPAGKTSDRAGPVAKPATPKASKSTSRVTTPKSIDQLAGAPDDSAPAPAPKAKKPKPQPQRVASADTGEAEATQTVSPEPEASGSGGFAVQLAAPGSEADARSTSSRLAKKFAGSLGGHHLGFRKAESNGKSVYRVRVSSLSRTDAVSLCEKLKADGGSCFVAKN